MARALSFGGLGLGVGLQSLGCSGGWRKANQNLTPEPYRIPSNLTLIQTKMQVSCEMPSKIEAFMGACWGFHVNLRERCRLET